MKGVGVSFESLSCVVMLRAVVADGGVLSLLTGSEEFATASGETLLFAFIAAVEEFTPGIFNCVFFELLLFAGTLILGIGT
jgi:hypothetical protein